MKVGDRVRYQPDHYAPEEAENGIVKEVRVTDDVHVWVVYNCAGKWDQYYNYTGCKTHIRDLKLGWN